MIPRTIIELLRDKCDIRSSGGDDARGNWWIIVTVEEFATVEATLNANGIRFEATGDNWNVSSKKYEHVLIVNAE